MFLTYGSDVDLSSICIYVYLYVYVYMYITNINNQQQPSSIVPFILFLLHI